MVYYNPPYSLVVFHPQVIASMKPTASLHLKMDGTARRLFPFGNVGLFSVVNC